MKKSKFYIEKEKLENQIKTQEWMISYELDKKLNAEYILSKIISLSIKRLVLKNTENYNNTDQAVSKLLTQKIISFTKAIFNNKV